MAKNRKWSRAESPKTSQLTGVESSDGVVFATGRRGVLLEREAANDWRALLLDGPEGDARDLLDASITDDGARIWFSGASGAFGYYDREAGETIAHTAPYDLTTTFTSISVSGAAGSETVHTADASGRMVRIRLHGGTLTVKGVSIPGDGTGFTEIVDAGEALFAADGNGLLYRSEGGREWRRKRLATTTIQALALAKSGLVAVDDGGTVYRDVTLFEEEDRTKRATPGISSPEEITADGGRIAVAGGGGELLTLYADGTGTLEDPGTDETLHAAELLADGTLIVAGSSGVIAEGTPRRD